MANLKNNTATMQSILQTVQNLPDKQGIGSAVEGEVVQTTSATGYFNVDFITGTKGETVLPKLLFITKYTEFSGVIAISAVRHGDVWDMLLTFGNGSAPYKSTGNYVYFSGGRLEIAVYHSTAQAVTAGKYYVQAFYE